MSGHGEALSILSIFMMLRFRNLSMRNFLQLLYCSALAIAFALGHASQADADVIVDFNNFNGRTATFGSSPGANGLNANIGSPIVTGGVSGGVGTYNVTLTNNFGTDTNGGVIGTQTLSFDVLVTAVSGTTVTFGSNDNFDSTVTLGTTTASVAVTTEDSFTVDNTPSGNSIARFAQGESLIFDIQNLSITGSNTATFEGFDEVQANELGGSGHRIFVGTGSGAFGDTFNANRNFGEFVVSGDGNGSIATSTFNNQTLVVSGGDSGSGSNRINIGLQQIDFTVSLAATTTAAVPEPSSLAFLGLGVIGFVVRRRRQK